ncbi:MAG TPA: hypothetical protein VIL49_14415, partial [Capillimicrobium sp.]
MLPDGGDSGLEAGDASAAFGLPDHDQRRAFGARRRGPWRGLLALALAAVVIAGAVVALRADDGGDDAGPASPQAEQAIREAVALERRSGRALSRAVRDGSLAPLLARDRLALRDASVLVDGLRLDELRIHRTGELVSVGFEVGAAGLERRLRDGRGRPTLRLRDADGTVAVERADRSGTPVTVFADRRV